MPAARRAVGLAAATAAAVAGVTAGIQPSSVRGCPSGSTYASATGNHLVPLADSSYNSWTLDFDIAVLKINRMPVL
ncbi:hypothetical protein [Streptomyces sp. NPDC052494]|uniref:hypothetical protein n=1 Tax=Streptomyces sp. NPDC052494 TaxID=3365692 RepID=UPI0037D5C412